ncbi:MAG: hypothetical protein R2877_00595 [Bdellovibrionota bacterium]
MKNMFTIFSVLILMGAGTALGQDKTPNEAQTHVQTEPAKKTTPP